MVWSSAFFPL